MHEDLIASGRRHVVVVAALGIVLLALALAIIFFPFALGVGALGTALGGTWGYGWKLIGLSFGMAFLFALAIVLVGFVWMFRHADRELLTPMHAFPRPFSGQTTSLPPPGAPVGEHKRVREQLDGLSIAAGVLSPSCALLRDPSPNCLTIGRRPETAWVIVTTGLVESLTRDELEAVLAYEIGRIAVREVSLDTAVYTCTARVFELWAAPFAGFAHDSFLLIPVSIVTAPLAFGCVLLRRHVLRSRAKLSDGLAVRYCRNPGALLSALRKIDADPRTVRAASLDDAHLWLQYPHTRLSSAFFGSRRILRQRIRHLEAITPGSEWRDADRHRVS